MLDSAEIVTTVAQPVAVVRLTVARAEIHQVMGPAISEVVAAAAAQGVGPAGPVFAHHRRMDPDTFDFEVGVPVTAPVAPSGRVQPSELPGALVARAVYRGPYDGLAAAWGELMAWITAEGHTPAPNLWERYVTGPDANPDPTTWHTELSRPLARLAGE